MAKKQVTVGQRVGNGVDGALGAAGKAATKVKGWPWKRIALGAGVLFLTLACCSGGWFVWNYAGGSGFAASVQRGLDMGEKYDPQADCNRLQAAGVAVKWDGEYCVAAPEKAETKTDNLGDDAPTEPLTEVGCDGAVLANLGDPQRYPELELGPGQGAVISVDPFTMTVGSETIVSAEGGLISIFNASDDAVKITIETSWNEPNQRWNVHACVFVPTEESAGPAPIFDRAAEWQGTPGSVSGEQKPFYATYVWDDGILTRQ